jgi:DNA-directed RNA polymerase specialized sigma24 family protein
MPDFLDTLIERDRRGRPVDGEELAEALAPRCRKGVMTFSAQIAEEAVEITTDRLVRQWKEGRLTIDKAGGIAPRSARNQAIDLVRWHGRRQTTDMEAGPEPEDHGADPHLKLEYKELGRQFLQQKAEFLAFITEKASPLVRFVDGYAAQGLTRERIAELANQNGFDTTPGAVRQIISRLMRQFPLLRQRWEKRAPDGTAERRRPRFAATSEQRDHVASLAGAAGTETALIHELRTTGVLAWDEVAARIQSDLGTHCTSTAARRTWLAFLIGLPEDLRHAAP